MMLKKLNETLMIYIDSIAMSIITMNGGYYRPINL